MSFFSAKTVFDLQTDDAFTSALNNGEVERRQQSWIAPLNVQQIFDSSSGNQLPIDQLTTPGLSSNESLGNL